MSMKEGQLLLAVDSIRVCHEFLCTGHVLNIYGSDNLKALVEQDSELCPGYGPFPGRHSPLPLGQVQDQERASARHRRSGSDRAF